jgi:hypothetical protein
VRQRKWMFPSLRHSTPLFPAAENTSILDSLLLSRDGRMKRPCAVFTDAQSLSPAKSLVTQVCSPLAVTLLVEPPDWLVGNKVYIMSSKELVNLHRACLHYNGSMWQLHTDPTHRRKTNTACLLGSKKRTFSHKYRVLPLSFYQEQDNSWKSYSWEEAKKLPVCKHNRWVQQKIKNFFFNKKQNFKYYSRWHGKPNVAGSKTPASPGVL